MLSVSKMGGAGHVKYYIELAREGYYLAGGEPEGQWLGSGAVRLGLSGKVDQQAIRRLFEGQMPDDKQALTQKQKYSAIHRGCGKVRSRQLGWDLTFSVPKSVSVAWAAADPETRRQIEAAIAKAIRKAIKHIEEHAAVTRRGHGGSRRERAKLVVAAFPHSTSRALDPQYHVHCLVLNIGVRDDGTGTLDSRPIYQEKMTAGAVFRAELASGLTRMGFRCQPAKHGFKLEGIPDSVCDHFSKRRKAITEKLAELGQDTAADAERVTLTTRQSKGEVPPRDQLLRDWQAQAAEFGVTPETIAALRSQNRVPIQEQNLEHVIDAAVESFAPTKDTFTRREITRHVLDNSVASGLDADRTTKATEQRLKTGGQFVRVDRPQTAREPIYMTRQAKALQADITARINRTKSHRSFIVPDAVVERSIAKFSTPRNPYAEEAKYHASQLLKAAQSKKTMPINRPLVHEQAGQTLDSDGRMLVRTMTQRPGRVVVVSHRFTDQRTLAVRAATRAWHKAGYQVIATSPYRRTTKLLEQETGAPTVTHRKLQFMMHKTFGYHVKHHFAQLGRAALNLPTYSIDAFRIDSSKVLIVDQAHRLSLEELSQLVRDVDRQGGKLVLLAPCIEDMPPGWANVTLSLLDDLSQPEGFDRSAYAHAIAAYQQAQTKPQSHHHEMEM
jgi:conjugative relaxase-like TrwC/TraI family protein